MSSPSSADVESTPPPASLSIHLDLVGGLAGDMFVAALVDAFPALEAPVLAEVSAARPPGAARATFCAATTSAGLRARRFGLLPAAAGSGAASGHRHEHAHAGTSYGELARRLSDSPLAPQTRDHALALLALLAEAEAHVHGIPVDAVHFHELADWDSLLDLVAAGCIAGKLAGARWSASAPPLGAGTVRTAHGLLPVPAPATSRLLIGYPWRDDGIAGERVTPTGAAILRHLVPAAACGARRDDGRLVAVGSGAGTRELAGVPNIVRVLVTERASAIDADSIAIIEFDVDDMTGEEIALAAERLRAHGGVLDVSFGSRVGKKGRPLADFRVLAQLRAADAVARACFTETSTLGLRMRDEQRRALRRFEAAVEVAGTPVNVKIAERPDGARTAKAAHDDVAQTRGLSERRQTRSTGERRALEGADE